MYFVSEVMEAKKKKMGRSHFPKIRGVFLALIQLTNSSFPSVLLLILKVK